MNTASALESLPPEIPQIWRVLSVIVYGLHVGFAA